MGSAVSYDALVSDRLPETYVPVDGSSEYDLELMNGLNFHKSPYLVVSIDSSCVQYCSDGFVQLTGLGFSSFQGKTLFEILAKFISVETDIKHEILSSLAKISKNLINIKGTLVESDREIELQLFVKPLINFHGNSSCWIVSVTVLNDSFFDKSDPTNSIAMRLDEANHCIQFIDGGISQFSPYKALSLRDNTLVNMLQERGEMFCITDPEMYDNPIVFASDEFISEIGYNRYEIHGINCRFLQGHDTSSEDVELIRNAINTKSHARVCLLNYRKNGTRFINQFNLSPLMAVDGTVAYFIGVQIEVDDSDIMPFPNSRQTLAEMLVDDDYY
mmetsp:Transcript_19338/g.28591  ORF Transcript_19338/g.28591 Transcript_19338/m.28591 type:complete len:331 (-) Transcript_19338:109-1101(-)